MHTGDTAGRDIGNSHIAAVCHLQKPLPPLFSTIGYNFALLSPFRSIPVRREILNRDVGNRCLRVITVNLSFITRNRSPAGPIKG